MTPHVVQYFADPIFGWCALYSDGVTMCRREKARRDLPVANDDPPDFWWEPMPFPPDRVNVPSHLVEDVPVADAPVADEVDDDCEYILVNGWRCRRPTLQYMRFCADHLPNRPPPK